MSRKGRGTVIVLMRKRTVFLIVLALILLAAALSAWLMQPDKQAISPEKVTAGTTVVLDAGHGGEDGGAVSSAGVPESSINLQIAKKMELLLIFMGENVALTREGNEAIYSPNAETLREKKVSDLNNRVKIVNEIPGSFLISIHQNSLPGSRVRGAQVFYNAVTPAQNVAASVQQALNIAVNPGNEKAAKQIDDTIYLMKNINRPGILAECGFMSNAAEAELLQTDGHQIRLSAAIVSGYLQYEWEKSSP